MILASILCPRTGQGRPKASSGLGIQWGRGWKVEGDSEQAPGRFMLDAGTEIRIE